MFLHLMFCKIYAKKYCLFLFCNYEHELNRAKMELPMYVDI